MDDLQKFLSDLSSIYWWISVFVVGVIASMFADVLFKILERTTSKPLASLRKIAEKRKIKIAEDEKLTIEELTKSHNYFMWYQKVTESRFTTSVLFFIFGFLVNFAGLSTFGFPSTRSYIYGGFSILLCLMAYRSFLDYWKRHKVIYKVLDLEFNPEEEKILTP